MGFKLSNILQTGHWLSNIPPGGKVQEVTMLNGGYLTPFT